MIHSGVRRFNNYDDEEKMIIKETDSEGNATGNIIVPWKPPKNLSGTAGDSSESNGTDWTEDFNDFNNGGGEPVTTPSAGKPPLATDPTGSPETDGAGNGNGTVTTTGTSDLQQKTLLDTQIAEVWNQITSRQPFSYDMNGDALYQQYADIYQNNANLAMQNAMAQSAALTGGYGNSYAQAAGQQAYAQQMQNLNDVGMELYDRAYGEYQAEGQELYNQLATLYGISQDKEASDQWHAINGDFEYDDKGNIIGLTGGEAAEAASTTTTYEGGGALNGQEVPKALAGVQGLTTTDTNLFNENGELKQVATVDVAYVKDDRSSNPEDVFTYNIGGKEVELRRGYSPYTYTMNPDAKNGTFNGYQPDNVASNYNGDYQAGRLTDTKSKTIMNGVMVPIYVDQRGTEWVYDAANNKYVKFEEESGEDKEN